MAQLSNPSSVVSQSQHQGLVPPTSVTDLTHVNPAQSPTHDVDRPGRPAPRPPPRPPARDPHSEGPRTWRAPPSADATGDGYGRGDDVGPRGTRSEWVASHRHPAHTAVARRPAARAPRKLGRRHSASPKNPVVHPKTRSSSKARAAATVEPPDGPLVRRAVDGGLGCASRPAARSGADGGAPPRLRAPHGGGQAAPVGKRQSSPVTGGIATPPYRCHAGGRGARLRGAGVAAHRCPGVLEWAVLGHGSGQVDKTVDVPAVRGGIYDRNGAPAGALGAALEHRGRPLSDPSSRLRWHAPSRSVLGVPSGSLMAELTEHSGYVFLAKEVGDTVATR